MKVKVFMPKIGTGMSEGSVARWLKEVGDLVKEGESICEIETAKVVQELPAPVGGVLIEQLVEIDEDVEVRTAIAIIDT